MGGSGGAMSPDIDNGVESVIAIDQNSILFTEKLKDMSNSPLMANPVLYQHLLLLMHPITLLLWVNITLGES
jgi:hypothetical protein